MFIVFAEQNAFRDVTTDKIGKNLYVLYVCMYLFIYFTIIKNSWNISRKKMSVRDYHHGQILAQFPFTTIEFELDFYHQKVNVRVDSRVAQELKT